MSSGIFRFSSKVYPSILSYCSKLLELYRTKRSELFQRIGRQVRRRMYPNLAHVSVAPVLVVTDHGNLNHERPHRDVSHLLDRDAHPAGRFAQIQHLDLLQVVEVRSAADRNPARGVALVQLVVGIDVDLTYRGLPGELDVYQMRQLPVRLPVRFHRVVPQLLNAESRFTGGQTPNRLGTNFTNSSGPFLGGRTNSYTGFFVHFVPGQ